MINNIVEYNILVLGDIIEKNQIHKKNYHFYSVKTCVELFDTLKTQNITMIILDTEYENIDYFHLLEELQKQKLLKKKLILALSDMTSGKFLKQLLKIGVYDFLRKPFLKEELFLKLELLIKKIIDKDIIEEQKKEIENNLKKLKEIVDSSINAMYVFEDNICIECNKEASEILGFQNKKAIISKELGEIFQHIPQKDLTRLLDNKINHYFETTLQNLEGKTFFILIKERNILIDGQYIKIISAMDLTEIKQNEKIVFQKTKLASMGEMIGNIAHQWRQPLTAISIAASGIKLTYECEIEERDETIKSLDNIVKNTKYLSQTIEDFQNYFKEEKEKTHFSLTQVVEQSLKIIDANLQFENIKVIKNISQDFEINSIQNELIQMLLNIINNAIDALRSVSNNEKYISISIYKKKDFIAIEILDTAGGVPSEMIDKIFEPYFTTKHQSQGTGLGLYMTHQMVFNLGGKIEVENCSFIFNDKRYHGAKFSLLFPINCC